MLKIKICASIATKKISKGISLIRKAEQMGADLIEIRLDYFDDTIGIRKIIESTSLPLIATNRQYEQGGHRIQKEEERIQSLIQAANLGFRYADIELTTGTLDSVVRKLKEEGVNVIISSHNFEGTPKISELEQIIRLQKDGGADICKLITTAKKINDNISCLLLTSKMNKIANVVCFAMGKRGFLSRILSPIFGAPFTYASVGKGLETALGQPTISELKSFYKRLSVGN